jgi:hypothetical protein
MNDRTVKIGTVLEVSTTGEDRVWGRVWLKYSVHIYKNKTNSNLLNLFQEGRERR